VVAGRCDEIAIDRRAFQKSYTTSPLSPRLAHLRTVAPSRCSLCVRHDLFFTLNCVCARRERLLEPGHIDPQLVRRGAGDQRDFHRARLTNDQDYYATHYIAEIANTLTNFFFVYLAIKSIRSCVQNGHDKVWIASFVVLLFVGVGSFLFHATLKYEMQLLDELSMIYLACTTFFAIFSHGQSRQATVSILVFSISLAIFVSVYYHYLQDPVFHQNAFAILTATNIFRGWYQMEHALRPSRRMNRTEKKNGSAQAREDCRNLHILSEMWMLSLSGVAYIAVGFFIWNLDNIFCGHIRQWRRAMGLPWGILLEGHAWW
jgi:dihydroceramidase